MMGFSRIHKTIILLFAVAAMTLWASAGMTQTVWDKYSDNPVLDRGPSEAWDDNHACSPSVLHDGEYKMWYSGDDGDHLRIGYATSPDGITWTKYPGNPVLDLGPDGTWDDNQVADPTVIFDGTYKMWYAGYDGSHWRIGYATSPDGIVWTKYAGNPVLDIGLPGEWDDEHVTNPDVILDRAKYKMWYSGDDGAHIRIGYAISPDGINWTKYAGNPVLDLGEPGEWDDNRVGGPTVLPGRTKYQIWYTGHDGTHHRIGYATSKDGIVWDKCDKENPVLEGDTGEWDYYGVASCSILFEGDEYKMWYSGEDFQHWRTGYATAPSTPCPCAMVSPGSVDELYQFRDSVLARNHTGRELTEIYYQHSAEVVDILGKKPMLVVRCSAVLKDIMPGILSLLGDKRGKDLIMTPLRVARIKNLFRDIGKEGGKELAQTLSMLSASLDKYKGMRVSQIWRAIDMKAAPGLKKDNLSTTWGSIKHSM